LLSLKKSKGTKGHPFYKISKYGVKGKIFLISSLWIPLLNKGEA